MIKMRLIFAVTSTLIGYVFMISIASAQGPPCDCNNLKDLQKELKLALWLQKKFDNESKLLTDSKDAKQEYYDFYTKNLRKDPALPPVPPGSPVALEFDPRGRGIHMDSLSKYSIEQQCAPSDELVKKINTLAVPCAGIAEALLAHEVVHQKVCMKVGGYLAYLDRKSADLAADEAAAYGVQVAALRGEIARILEHAEVSIQVVTTTRAEMPKNPLYTALNMKANGDLKVSSSPVFIDPIIRFDAKGQQTNTASIEGNCAITYGYPASFQTHGTIETDGLEAQIHYSADGTRPASGMECHLPGGEKGFGGSMPGPVNDAGYIPPAINLKLEDGAENINLAWKDRGAYRRSESPARWRVRSVGQFRPAQPPPLWVSRPAPPESHSAAARPLRPCRLPAERRTSWPLLQPPEYCSPCAVALEASAAPCRFPAPPTGRSDPPSPGPG